MSALLDALSERVLLCDGGIGSLVQETVLDTERDFYGHENCTDILSHSRPDLVRDIHKRYFAAGADMVETNTFGASPITLGEFGLSEMAYDLNRSSVELAREAADEFANDGRERFVLGSIGPGTRLPSLGHIDYATQENALFVQCAGLIKGGVDGFIIETCQDLLQVKAAVNAAKRACSAANTVTPIIVQVTVETTGTLLTGSDIAAAATVINSLDIPVMGINCATGPQEMFEHVHWLCENWPGFISVQPNAGLPELVDGVVRYPLRPLDLVTWLERFVLEEGVAMIGGCCGTTPDHIFALDAMLKRLEPRGRPAVKNRSVHSVPAVASLFTQTTLRQENAYLSIGERCNANGSKKFREAQERSDWDACLALARDQVREGSSALDLCTAFVGRDEVTDMVEVVTRLRGGVSAPLVIDSTDTEVIETVLKLYGGKAIINSINFEEGEELAEARLKLARTYGAAVIALTIDEDGMAKDVKCKLEIARRLYDFAVNRHSLPPSDLLFDPLTFTIATGSEEDRKLGLWTLEAIEAISAEMPDCQIVLGLSNISFGLAPAARAVLNSVFLDHALKRGMTSAIVHVSKIMPLHKIAPEEVAAADDLIFDRRREGYDPLKAFMALFDGRKTSSITKIERAETVEKRLQQRIVDGDRLGLENDLEEALVNYSPLAIINELLLEGMKTVGELFGSGKMQLPFVLQAAETMKQAVGYLEPRMEKREVNNKGTMVLATVRGDVHDIGKNLVDIILTNNGYRVVNLGIKQPIGSILEAALEHEADAIGMSGLLVKSTVVMRENIEEMSRQNLTIPVILGGAALTRKFVEEDCVRAYVCKRVSYARDAFDGLMLMNQVMTGNFDNYVAAVAVERERRPSNRKRALGQAANEAQRPVDADEARLRRNELNRDVPVPVPPFWGSRVISDISPKALIPYLNENTLYQFQWGFRKAGRSLEEYNIWTQQEVRPILKRMLDLVVEEKILQPCAIYGYWKAAAEGSNLILYEEDGKSELVRFALPRQRGEGGLSIVDFLRDVSEGAEGRDVIGLQVVTMGRQLSEVARKWFADNRYKDYLYLHGFGVEMAEAMAEYVHKRIRADLGFAAEDAQDISKMLRQGYRGSRYSFGYPACPNLADQRHLLSLLKTERIDVTLSEEDQLEPEQSTSAIVLHHPQAKYFSV